MRQEIYGLNGNDMTFFDKNMTFFDQHQPASASERHSLCPKNYSKPQKNIKTTSRPHRGKPALQPGPVNSSCLKARTGTFLGYWTLCFCARTDRQSKTKPKQPFPRRDAGTQRRGSPQSRPPLPYGSIGRIPVSLTCLSTSSSSGFVGSRVTFACGAAGMHPKTVW